MQKHLFDKVVSTLEDELLSTTDMTSIVNKKK